MVKSLNGKAILAIVIPLVIACFVIGLASSIATYFWYQSWIDGTVDDMIDDQKKVIGTLSKIISEQNTSKFQAHINLVLIAKMMILKYSGFHRSMRNGKLRMKEM